MKMLRYHVSIYLYTDDDWGFNAKEELSDSVYAQYMHNTYLKDVVSKAKKSISGCWNGRYDYSSYQLDDGYVYAFGFEVFYDEHLHHRLENTLNRLKKDLEYPPSHDWIKEEFDDMVDSAIEFIKRNEAGTYIGRLQDGNWQPSILTIVAEELD